MAALSFQEGQQRPHSALDSAMSGRHRNMSGTKTGTGRWPKIQNVLRSKLVFGLVLKFCKFLPHLLLCHNFHLILFQDQQEKREPVQPLI